MSEPGEGLAPPPPPSEPPGGGGGRPGNPWEQRTQLGFLQGFLENLKLFVTSPTEAFARTRESGDLASPVIWAVLLGWAMAIVSALWSALFGSSLTDMLPPEYRHYGLMGGGGNFFFTVFVAPIFIVIGLFIGSALIHLSAMLVGALSSSQAGFEGTLRVVSYAQVAQIARFVPFVGDLVSFVWIIVLAVIGMTSIHHTSQGKALLAVLLPLLLCCLCGIGFTVLGVGAMMGLAGAQ